MSGIAAVRKDFESMPKRGFVDLTKDSDPPEFSESQMSLRDSTSLSQLLQLSQSNWRRMHLLRTPFLPRSRLLMGWTLRALRLERKRTRGNLTLLPEKKQNRIP